MVAGSQRPRLGALSGAPVIALLVALLAAACAGTGYNYVKNSDDRTYFKVPDDWRLFDEDEVLEAAHLSPREEAATRDLSWQVQFDAHPRPSLKHVFSPNARHPWGLASVEELTFEMSDNVSMNQLRNQFLDIDAAVQEGLAEVVTYEPLELEGGFRGFRMVADYQIQGGPAITLNQTTLLDQATSKLYTLLVACNARCYEENEDTIDRVVESWTVEA